MKISKCSIYNINGQNPERDNDSNNKIKHKHSVSYRLHCDWEATDWLAVVGPCDPSKI